MTIIKYVHILINGKKNLQICFKKLLNALFRHSNDFFLNLNYTPYFIKLTSKIITLQFDELGLGFFFAIAIISHVLICTHKTSLQTLFGCHTS